MDTKRKITVDIERNRVRVVINHGEDEEIIKLSLSDARELILQMQSAVLDYDQRKQVRID